MCRRRIEQLCTINCCKQAISPTTTETGIVGVIAIFRQLQGKNESAPDRFSHGTLAERPSPEACSPPPYVLP
jgi:hypothetical protein